MGKRETQENPRTQHHHLKFLPRIDRVSNPSLVGERRAVIHSTTTNRFNCVDMLSRHGFVFSYTSWNTNLQSQNESISPLRGSWNPTIPTVLQSSPHCQTVLTRQAGLSYMRTRECNVIVVGCGKSRK